MMGKTKPLSPEAAKLLGYERELDATPTEVRRRVLARARFAQRVVAVPQHNPLKTRYVVVGALTFALGAAAYGVMRSRAELSKVAANDDEAMRLPEPSAAEPEGPQRASTPPAVTSVAVEDRDTGPFKLRETTTKSAVNTGDALARELALLKKARSSMSAGNQSRALTALQEHTQQFPSGRLREEREALRVTVLWNMGRRAEARRAAASFVKQFPRSVLAAQMAAKAKTEP